VLSLVDLRECPPGELSARLPRPGAGRPVPADAVAAILEEVRQGGDAALGALTARFDGVQPRQLRVPTSELADAAAGLDRPLRRALEEAAGAIEDFHRHGLVTPRSYRRGRLVVEEQRQPVGRAGCYVPGGRARYPSSLLMTAIPARVAGVSAIAVTVPPGPDGRIDPVTLAAAHLVGVEEVYAVGGAQAIAALAFGTETIPAVDVIAGPGNAFVAEAQRQLRGRVGVAAAFAGPSEVVVVADRTVDPGLAAIDLAVQAEHGPDGLAWLVTWSQEYASAVDDELARVVASSPRRGDLAATLERNGYAALVDGPDQAIDVANVIAPEHLELLSIEAAARSEKVRAAGAVFLGPWAPASVGDYVAGPSHVLPTFGTARFASALGVEDFQVRRHTITVDRAGLADLAPSIVALAEAEGLAAHARSVLVRVSGSGPEGGVGPGGSPLAAVGSAGGRAEGPVDEEAGGGDGATGAPVDSRLAGQPTGGDTTVSDGPGPAALARADLAGLRAYRSPLPRVEVRLHANEPPGPPPAAWRSAVVEVVQHLDPRRYPDPDARELRAAIGRLHGVQPEEVFCANGSNEVLQTLLLAFGGPGRRALLFEPTYSLHRRIARVTGTEVVALARDPELLIPLAEASALLGVEPVAITFACSPNNPTGRNEPVETLQALAGLVKGLLLVDRAYAAYAGQDLSGLRRGPGGRRVVEVHTFSKAWALAGLRLGYCLADPEVVEVLEAVALPYRLDSLTQAAGVLALSHREALERQAEEVVAERERLARALVGFGVVVWPSDANFLLFRVPGWPGSALWQTLVAEGVLVRDFSDTEGVRDCLRVTIGRPAENDRFLAALARLVGERAPNDRRPAGRPDADSAGSGWPDGGSSGGGSSGGGSSGGGTAGSHPLDGTALRGGREPDGGWGADSEVAP